MYPEQIQDTQGVPLNDLLFAAVEEDNPSRCLVPGARGAVQGSFGILCGVLVVPNELKGVYTESSKVLEDPSPLYA